MDLRDSEPTATLVLDIPVRAVARAASGQVSGEKSQPVGNGGRSGHRHKHNRSFQSSSNSESNIDSPRLSVGECSSSTPTSIEEGATQHQKRILDNNNDGNENGYTADGQNKDHEQDQMVSLESRLEDLAICPLESSTVGPTQQIGTPKIRDDILKSDYKIVPKNDNQEKLDTNENLQAGLKDNEEASILDNNSLVQTDSYIQDLNDEHILLNKRVSRISAKRTRTQESVRKSIPFHASKHSQILPMDQGDHERKKITNLKSTNSIVSLPAKNQLQSQINTERKYKASSFSSLPPQPVLKNTESATAEIKKMKKLILHKRDLKKKRKSFLMDDDRVLIGNKVSEGHVNFIIAYNMLTGIRVAVSRCSGIMKPLTPKDFKFTKKLAFDYHGNELTPSSQYAFKFKDYSPEVFRELRALFGLDPADYLVSLTSKYILSELNSPGKSGSFFYFSRDYKYIIKTIHHGEHLHLRRHLQEYYHHVKKNPDTLLCQFYGLHRVKMPISFKNKVKHRKIYFLVMNNLFPPHLEIHTSFDLKGSTWGRLTKVDSSNIDERPVLKDLNWLDQSERIKFGPLKKKKFLEQLERDVELLAKLNIMDYSLLLGIHDMSKDTANDITLFETESARNDHTTEQLRHGSVIPHFFKEFEGGIRSSDPFNNDTDLIYYVGIIDCLTNYSFIKKLETFWRGLNHDLKVVSAIPPKDYANRFYEFIADSVDALPPARYKDDPVASNYRD